MLFEALNDAASRHATPRVSRSAAGYRAHFEAAKRLLNAPDGSEERALAQADMASARARDEGRDYQEQGGDARAVLARLRRRQGEQRGT